MEALQMLKFYLKKEHLNFTKGWMTVEKEMLEDEPDEDPLQKLLQGDFQNNLDMLMQSIDIYDD